MIFSFLILMVITSLFLFMNPLYYAIILLIFSSLVCFILVSSTLVLPITGLMIMIVYAGAMMILIGYVCAISPNIYVNATSNSKLITVICLSLVLSILIFTNHDYSMFTNYSSFTFNSTLLDYFYSPSGCFMFLMLILMLFLTILIVTTQYMSPKGPFRAVS